MHISLFQRLISEGIVVCPKCRIPKLSLNCAGYLCTQCQHVWRSNWNVPDFFGDYVHSQAVAESDIVASGDLVLRICSALSLEKDATTVATVAQILDRAARLHAKSASLTAEIADIQDRFFGGERFDHPPISPDANRTLSAEFERHYFPPSVARSVRFSANIRVRNKGVHDWSSRTASPAALKAQWLGQKQEAAFAHFPIDISPGRAITVPVKMVAPETLGASTVRVSVECVGTRKAAAQYLDIPIDVRPAHRVGEYHDHLQLNTAILDYAEDHRDALNFLLSYAEKTGRSRMRMLEVGSGPHPQLAWMDGCELVAVDISAPLLALGSLYFGQRFAHRLAFLCADALELPFADETFDLVAMFSTLHHFAQPEILLRRLSALVGADGILAVMCEPVDDTITRTAIVRDLLKGINEQVFSVAEYLRIFDAAGLAVLSIKVDGGSLKAILKKA